MLMLMHSSFHFSNSLNSIRGQHSTVNSQLLPKSKFLFFAQSILLNPVLPHLRWLILINIESLQHFNLSLIERYCYGYFLYTQGNIVNLFPLFSIIRL